MDLLQLEHFLAVVEEGSFTRAAERMSRTQPAISQSIKKLEDEIGAPLLARVPLDPVLREAADAGEPARESAPGAEGVAAIDALAESLQGSRRGTIRTALTVL